MFQRLPMIFILLGAFTRAQSAMQAGTEAPPFIDMKTDHPPIPVGGHLSEMRMPDEALRRGESGVCALTFVVDLDGNTQNIRLLRCTDAVFTQAAIDAVKKARFKPATKITDNHPFAASVRLTLNFGFDNHSRNIEPPPRLHLGFLVPNEPPTSGPDAQGAFTLSHSFDAPNAFPTIKKLVNDGFGKAAFALDDGAGCIVHLLIGKNGVPSDAQVTNCDDPILEKPAVDSLLQSRFTPAVLDGKPVPVRASVHLIATGFEPMNNYSVTPIDSHLHNPSSVDQQPLSH